MDNSLNEKPNRYTNRTAVLVLNWNKPELTMESVESLDAMEGEYDIFVIDNGSDENKRKKLIEEMKKKSATILYEKDIYGFKLDIKGINNKFYLLILLEKNYGYGKGNNYGLKLACSLGYGYSLISNNDIKIIDKNVLEELIKGIKSNKRNAWAAPKIISYNGRQHGPYEKFDFIKYSFFVYGIFYPFYFLFKKKKYENKAESILNMFNNEQLEPWWTIGCFIFFSNAAIEKINFFDENIFLYFEELVIAEKFKQKAFMLKYLPNISVFHEHNYSADGYNFKKKYIEINSLLYFYKNYRYYNLFKLYLAKISMALYLLIYRPLILIAKWKKGNIKKAN